MKLFFSLTIPYEDDQILEALDLPFCLFLDAKCTCSTEIWRSSYKTTKSCSPERIKQLVKETKANYVYINIKTKDDSNYWLKNLEGCLSVSPLNNLWPKIKVSEAKRRIDRSLAYSLRNKKTNLKFQNIEFFPTVLELILDIADGYSDSNINQQMLNHIIPKLDALSDLKECIGFAYFLEGVSAEFSDEGPEDFLRRTIADRLKRWPMALPLMKTKFPGFYPFLFGPTTLCNDIKKTIDKVSDCQKHATYFQGKYYSGIAFSDETIINPQLRFHNERYMNVPFTDETVSDSEVLNQIRPFLISLKGFAEEKKVRMQDYPGVFCHDNGSVIGYIASEYNELVASGVLPPLYDDFGLLEFPSPSFQKILGVISDDVLVYPENLRGIEFVEGKLKAKYEEISKTSSNTTQNILTTYEDLTNGILMPYRDLFHKARELGLFDEKKTR